MPPMIGVRKNGRYFDPQTGIWLTFGGIVIWQVSWQHRFSRYGRRKRKLLLIMLYIFVALSLIGCGGPNPTPQPTETPCPTDTPIPGLPDGIVATPEPTSIGVSGTPLPTKSVSVHVTQLYGSSRNVAGDLREANNIFFSQASVQILQYGTTELVPGNVTREIIGEDLILEEFDTPSAPTREEIDLIAYNFSTIPEGVIPVYYVPELSKGSVGESFPPFAGNSFVAAIIANRAADHTLAHELGHILMNIGHEGYENDESNLMYPFSAGRENLLDPDQIKSIRSSPYLQ